MTTGIRGLGTKQADIAKILARSLPGVKHNLHLVDIPPDASVTTSRIRYNPFNSLQSAASGLENPIGWFCQHKPDVHF